jgi:restriction system protein
MGWLIAAAVIIAGSYYFHFMPALRRQKLRILNERLSQLGGSPRTSLPRHLFNDEQYQAARQVLDLEILEQLALKVVDVHRDVLARKKNQTLYPDDYGNLRDDAWLRELRYFVRHVLLPLDTSCLGAVEDQVIASPAFTTFTNVDDKQIVDYWARFLDDNIEAEERHVYLQFQHSMTGHEYEEYVADQIRSLGWKAKVTSGSGDHGADIIAEHDGSRVAIQCKFYRTPVGNKSVQEAFSAKSFYDCDFACVVTNSSFTPAARKAAAKLGVALLHHENLSGFFSVDE